ncbi:hypothetical protein QZH41_002925 [Actinostola sp. cb2023]|nr:hypothetical protein QZH41_002925 [Actinostola sp. cb2023]
MMSSASDRPGVDQRIVFNGHEESIHSSFNCWHYWINLYGPIGTHTIAAIKTADDYSKLNASFGNVIKDVNSPIEQGSLEIDNVKVNLEFFLGGDYKLQQIASRRSEDLRFQYKAEIATFAPNHQLVFLDETGIDKRISQSEIAYRIELEETYDQIKELSERTSQDSMENVLQHPSCSYILHLFNKYRDHLQDSNGKTSEFWMSYVRLVENVLGLIRASREGNWVMHMAFIREMIPWCFAYDKHNYARYLTVYYAQMTRLPEDHPDIYNHFMDGGFSVQLGDCNPFAKIPVDQATEETVNKDTQTAGGTKGFSLKPGTVSKYYLTAEYRSTFLKQLRQMIELQTPGLHHADLGISRIKKDEADVQILVDLFEKNWTNPFDPSDELVSISTGTAATPEISKDLLGAYTIGEQAYTEFKEKRIENESSQKFHDRLPKHNLKSFTNIKAKKKTKSSNKEAILKADHRLFGRMVLIATSRNLQMKDVLKHPLGPLPWALANCDGTLKKTNKSSLARNLEKKIASAAEIPQPSACIIDGMSLVQKVQAENKTFAELSEHLLVSALRAATGSARVDVVFDVYNDNSIKNSERVRRGSGILFTNIAPGHKIQQWRRLLACSASKTHLINFLAHDWQKPEIREKLGDKELYVTCREMCFRITKDSCERIEPLASSQEEADTRMLLHAYHAAPDFESVVVHADDTDVLILLLAFSQDIVCNIFMKCGTQTRIRFIDVTKLSRVLGENVCKALIGVHAFTGCDSVSAFAGRGKLSALNLLDNVFYRQGFADLGKEWQLTDQLFGILEEFTCRLYSLRSPVKDVNELRYQLFRTKKGDVESGQIPPCRDCLYLHALRANYQAGIWQRSLESNPVVPSPVGHGWFADHDGPGN